MNRVTLSVLCGAVDGNINSDLKSFNFNSSLHFAQLIKIIGWLAHLARHAPRNTGVKYYSVGSNLTGSINS